MIRALLAGLLVVVNPGWLRMEYKNVPAIRRGRKRFKMNQRLERVNSRKRHR